LTYYPWLVAVHILAWTAWMAGMLYLPRLFVYHAEVGAGTPQSETFKVMERRLLKAILNPAMVAVWVTGLWLGIASGYLKSAGWLHAKLLLVLLMSGVHGFLAASTKRFARDANTRPARFYRVVNEIPTVLLIGIVVLAVVKPF
jgi:protoporphyrinogen IX oxidase